MRKESETVITQLKAMIADLEAKQAAVKKGLTSYKKSGCDSNVYAAFQWMRQNKELFIKEIPGLDKLADDLAKCANDTMLQFDADFREIVSKEGWSLLGQWPEYYVEHLIPVTVDDKNYGVQVGTDKMAAIDLTAIRDSIKKQIIALRPDKAKLSKFLDDLYAVYSKLLARQPGSVSVWDVYREIVIIRQPIKFWRDADYSTFKSFRELEFRAYLTELLKQNMTAVSGYDLRLLPPIEKDDFMYIYQPIENRFSSVGRIDFIKK